MWNLPFSAFNVSESEIKTCHQYNYHDTPLYLYVQCCVSTNTHTDYILPLAFTDEQHSILTSVIQ